MYSMYSYIWGEFFLFCIIASTYIVKNKTSSDVDITDGDSQQDSFHPWPYFLQRNVWNLWHQLLLETLMFIILIIFTLFEVRIVEV